MTKRKKIVEYNIEGFISNLQISNDTFIMALEKVPTKNVCVLFKENGEIITWNNTIKKELEIVYGLTKEKAKEIYNKIKLEGEEFDLENYFY